MGIERFFNSLVKNEVILGSEGILVLEKKIETDYFYIDFNSIIYKISQKVEEEINKILYFIVYKSSVGFDEEQYISEIAKKWDFDVKSSVMGFEEKFTNDFVDNKIFSLVKEDILFISTKLVDGSKIKRLYISMDSVPNMAKMIEQKKRRYNGYVINSIKKDIFEKYKDKLDERRQVYEKYKYVFSRSKILSSHLFMRQMEVELTSGDFMKQVKESFSKLEKYIFSGINNPGEGEKKIMEDIIEGQLKGKYVIYSPDADVIVLSIIMLNQIVSSELFVMRFDQNSREYGIVDINKLGDGIFNYILNAMPANLISDSDKVSVLNDIAFLFTVFGNDFIPKIESIDVRKDFEILLLTYVESMKINKKDNKFIISSIENRKYKLDYGNLCLFFYNLGNIENILLIDTYMSKNYKNYNFLKQTLGVINLHMGLTDYVFKANIIFSELKKLVIELNKLILNKAFDKKSDLQGKGVIREIIDNNFNKLLNKVIGKNSSSYIDLSKNPELKRFIKAFIILESPKRGKEDKEIKDEDLYYLMRSKLKSYIKLSDNNIRGEEVVMFQLSDILQLRLVPYESSVNSKFHSEKVIKTMISESMKVTNLDKELYSFENMLDDYKYKLNAIDDGIGFVEIRNINDKYNYFYYPFESSTKRYYYSYFERFSLKQESISDICENYIKGIYWVFDFYFNRNNSKFNYENISVWFYKYEKAPLIGDIYKFLKKNKVKFVDEFVKREKFMNPIEHYLYITPLNNLDFTRLSTGCGETIKVNNYMFKDLDMYVQKIINGKKVEDLYDVYNNEIPIDCRRASYLSKCVLTPLVHAFSFGEFINTIRDKCHDGKNEFNSKPYTMDFTKLAYKGGRKLVIKYKPIY